jgi:predicted SAM-dependent methyltransferase
VRLNLGCGERKDSEEVGLDIRKEVKPDILCDLNQGIPLRSECADEIYTSHFLEHLDEHKRLIRDVVRVGKPNAKFVVVVPYWSFECAMFTEHRCTFPPEWFRRICKEKEEIQYWFGGENKPHLELEDITYHYTSDGVAICRQLGISLEQGRKFLNNVVHEIVVTMRVIK